MNLNEIEKRVAKQDAQLKRGAALIERMGNMIKGKEGGHSEL